MFEMLDERRRPQIKWWTLPSVLVIVLCLGIDIGLLIGRRNGEISQWIQIAFLAFMVWWLVSPVVREIKTHFPHTDNHGE
jgi:ABC-type polysaccharide/polyol phosphate export permease